MIIYDIFIEAVHWIKRKTVNYTIRNGYKGTLDNTMLLKMKKVPGLTF